MNFDIVTKKLRRLVPLLAKYRYILGAIVILGVFSFIVLRIESLASPEINEERYNQGILELDSVVFDVESIERINELRALEVDVRENINQGRTNPF